MIILIKIIYNVIVLNAINKNAEKTNY
jgi:hypothetical protein